MKKNKIKKRHRIKKRKPIFENNIISGFFILLCCFFFLFYFIVFYPKFQLKEIIIENEKYINKEVLIDFIKLKINKKIYILNTQSLLRISEKELRKELLERMPIVKDVKIKKKFPATINLKIEERVPASIWCQEKNSCYYIDKEGVAFQKAEFIGKNFFIAIKEKENFLIGDTVLDREEIEIILLIKKNLERFNLNILYFHIHSKEKIEVMFEDRWYILFSQRNIKEGLDDFQIIYERKEDVFDKKIEYIDLRFKDRGFVK